MSSISFTFIFSILLLFNFALAKDNDMISLDARSLLEAATFAEQSGDLARRDALVLRCAAAEGDEQSAQLCRSMYCGSLLTREQSVAVLELAVCQLAVAHDPRNVELLEITAGIFDRLNLHKESLPYLRNAYRLTHSPLSYYKVCLTYLRAGDCFHALSCIEVLLKSDSKEVQTIMSGVYDLYSITLSVCDAGNLTGNRAMIRGCEIYAGMVHGLGCPSYKLNTNIMTAASKVTTVIEGKDSYGILESSENSLALPEGIVERARKAGVNYSLPWTTSFNSKRVAILTIDNAVLESEHGVWFRATPYCEVFFNDHMLVNKIQRFFSAGSKANKVLQLSDVPEMVEEVASAVQQVPSNYYHATVDIAARIAVLQKYVLSKNPAMPLLLPDNSLVKEVAELFGVAKDRRIIWWNATQLWRFKRVHIVDMRVDDGSGKLMDPLTVRDPWSYLYPSKSVVQLMRSMIVPNLRSVEDLIASGDWRVVYLTRRDTNIRKVVDVEPAILESIKELIGPEHLVVFEGHTRTLKEQIELMQQAVVIMGPHGAGFANMLWMPSGGSVLLFPLVPTGDQCVLGVAAAVGLHYHEVPVVTSHYYTEYHAFSPKTTASDVKKALQFALKEIGLNL